MKKDKNSHDSNYCCHNKIFSGFEKQVKTKIGEAQKYIKKNPKKTKTMLASLGAGLMVILAFFVGKNKNKNQDIDLD